MNLRDRARTLLQGLTPSPPARPQSYDVVCPEGHRLRGHRTVGYQALRCPTCGEGIFVLPRSPLPEPPVPAAGSRDGKSASRMGSGLESESEPGPIPLTDPVVMADAEEAGLDGEVVWVDEMPESGMIDPTEAGLAEIEQITARERNTEPKKTRPRSRPEPSGRPSQPHAAAAEVAVAEPMAPRPSLADWVRRWRNPLLFLGVTLLIVATISLRQWRQYRQDLPRIAALGRVEGLAALDEGEFDKAYQLLSRARHAAESLGDAVEGAAQIHQGAAEAEIFVRLVPDRLESILDTAGRADPKEWPERFATLYKGRSIIVDTHVIATPAASSVPGTTRYELDYQILPDGEEKPFRVGRIDTTGFRLFEVTQPKVGDRVTFGARLASFAYDEQSHEWRVGLEPDSGVYMTHPKALEALGWPTFADLPPKEGAEQ